MSQTTDPTIDLVSELNASTQELRGSLTELLGGVGVDPKRAQVMSRSLRLDKSLAWKISTIVKSGEAGETVRCLPGTAAFEIFLSAVRTAGAPARSLARASSAFKAIQVVVERHVGDRPTMEVVMDGLPEKAAGRLEMSRKLAFRGNSGLWGVQAKTRVSTAILVPSDSAPDMLDLVVIGAWVDFRRLRADSRWVLFSRRWYGTVPEPKEIPLDDNEPTGGPMLLREFCTPSLPPILAAADPNGDMISELGPSSVGNAGAFTCFFGSRTNRVGSRYERKDDKRGQLAAGITAPVEALQFDLLVHRDCAFATKTRAEVYGKLTATEESLVERDLLPIDLSRTELGNFPPVMDSPRIAEYGKVIDHALKRCGWNRQDFMGIRYSLDFPPFPSTVVVSFPLESRSAGA